MDPQRRQKIARAGGIAAAVGGNAHQFTSEETRAAGRKGGENRRHMAEIGRRGGTASSRKNPALDEAALNPEHGR